LNAELSVCGLGEFSSYVDKITDSLAVARAQFPGKKNNLDALCERLGVNNKDRVYHGALMDAQILALVWSRMSRSQDALFGEADYASGSYSDENKVDLSMLDLPLVKLSAEDLAAHEAYLDQMEAETKVKPIWRAFGI
jgi:DNA polymerase-3 subunit epsilon